MTEWFYLLPLMVLGFCDAFDRFSRGNKDSVALIDSPSRSFTESVYSRAVRTLTNGWLDDGPNNPDNSHRCKRRSNKSSGSAEEHPNSKHPSNWTSDLSVSNINHHDSTINDYSFDSRRLFWEPIFDGKIIGLIGNLFNDNIKNEADKERKEREKMREEALLKKYTAMLNDSKQLAELKQESANSPSHVNQIIRRSFKF